MSLQPTVAAVMHEHGTARADRPALTFAADPAVPEADRVLTYAQLDLAARKLAGWLRERHPVGARALLLYPPGLEFGVAFAACMYAGVIAVPVPMPTAPRRLAAADPAARRDQPATGIAADADVAVVLTDAAGLPAVLAWRDTTERFDLPCVATDVLDLGDGSGWRPPPADVPLMLQYTSGSTSQPRGVIISHENVLAQVAMTRRVMAVGEDSRFGGWLPMHHDMGLIVQLLQPLVLGASSVFMSPFEFLKRPRRWLQLIQRQRVDVSLAPHSGYEMACRQITDEQIAGLDLSGWTVAGVGAETVRAQTLTAFAQRLAPAGFRPEALTIGYGLAEATVYVSVGTRTDRPVILPVDRKALERNEFTPTPPNPDNPLIVSCGYPCEMEVRVVDPDTGHPVPDGQVGEIWVRGAGVALGYWNAPEATAKTFGGTMADGETGFLRTGDLGALHRGEVYVTGRRKDLLIVRGRNLHPQDIEQQVRSLHESLDARFGAVFSVATPDEQVVVVQECTLELAGGPDRLADIAGLIRDWLAREVGLRPAGVVLLRPGGVSRTPSGKVQRSLVRERFLSDLLDPLYEALDPGLRRYCRPNREPAAAVPVAS